FEVPPRTGENASAVNLADSLNTRHPHSDAFRFRRNVYGLHFHPEVTLEMLQKRGKDDWGVSDWPEGDLKLIVATGRAILTAWVELACSGWRLIPPIPPPARGPRTTWPYWSLLQPRSMVPVGLPAQSGASP